ncbi:hypothetical protein Hanom_Chr04g00385251 [Helianthus anomalus]
MNLEEFPAPATVFSCNFIWVFKITDGFSSFSCKFIWVFEITDGFSSSTAYIKFANDDVSKFLVYPATFSGKGILMEKIEAPLKKINKIVNYKFCPLCLSQISGCPLPLKLMSFVLNVSKSCTLYPLGKTQLIFFVKYLTFPGASL